MTHSTAETLAAPRARLLHRLRLNNALTLLIWGLLVALVLIGAGQVFQFNAKPWIGALALALLIWGMVRDWRLPSRLAYKLDHLAGLNQGYATASELAAQAQDPGPVGRVLLNEQRAIAERLSVKRILPLLSRTTWAALIASLGLGAWLWNASLHDAAPLDESTQTAEEAAEESAPVSEMLEKIAERMAEDATEEENTYLAAVAKSLAEKAEQFAAAPDDAALREEIETLLEHARRAYGKRPPSWLGDGSNAQPLENITQAFADTLRREAEAAAARAARQEENGGEPLGNYYDRDPTLEERYRDRDSSETIAGESSDQMPGSADGKQEADAPTNSAGGSPRRMEDEELQSLGSAPVGAALQSGKGESDMAGLGSEEFADDTTYREVTATPGESVSLTAEQQAGGNRIRIEIAPEANEETQSAGASGGRFSAEELDRAAMGAERSEIPVSARAIVAKYLDRRTVSGGSEEGQ